MNIRRRFSFDKYRHEHPEDPIILELDREMASSRDSVGSDVENDVPREQAADS